MPDDRELVFVDLFRREDELIYIYNQNKRRVEQFNLRIHTLLSLGLII